MTPLLEICSVRTGKRDANHGSIDAPYPFFTCAAEPIQSPTYSFDGDSIVLPGNGANVGLVIFYSGKFEAYQRTYVLSDFKCNARYVYHHLNQHWKNVNASSQYGSATNYIRMGNFESYSLPLPPLSEQKRIAEILDRAEALRAKRRAALALLDELTQSIFLDMFGDPVSNPKGWNLVKFEQLCSRITVGIVVKPASYYVGSGVPALRSLNVKPGKIVMEDLVFFSQLDNETKLKKTKLKSGDLVLVRSGQPGTCAVIPHELDGVNAIDLLIASPNDDTANQTFLCEFFNSAGGRDLVLSKQRGQIQKHLNVGALNEALIPLPPLALQCKFAARAASTKELESAVQNSLVELDQLFASLQHRAFRGEL